MATVPGTLLLAISSPYARRAELWKEFEQHFGRDEAKLLDGKVTLTPTRDDSGKPGHETQTKLSLGGFFSGILCPRGCGIPKGNVQAGYGRWRDASGCVTRSRRRIRT